MAWMRTTKGVRDRAKREDAKILLFWRPKGEG